MTQSITAGCISLMEESRLSPTRSVWTVTWDCRTPGGGGDVLQAGPVTGPGDVLAALGRVDKLCWEGRESLLPWRVVPSDLLSPLTVQESVRARGGAAGTFRRAPGESMPESRK